MDYNYFERVPEFEMDGAEMMPGPAGPDGERGPSGPAGADGARGEEADEDDTSSTDAMQEPEITRDEFPETWLWADTMTGYTPSNELIFKICSLSIVNKPMIL